jgi:hypothetical protein
VLLIPRTAAALEGPGTTGAAYLTLSLGPKSIAMGEVKAALPGDPFDWIANPAALGWMDGTGLGAVHAQWILDTQYEHLSAHHRVNRHFAAAGSFFFQHRPDIPGADDIGKPTGPLANNNYQAVVGLAFSPVRSFSAGVNVKYFRERLDSFHAGGVAVDVGVAYSFSPVGIRLGVAAQNLGADVKFDEVGEPLPSAIRAGASHTFAIAPRTLECTYAFDLVKPRFESLFLSAGAEARICRTLALRAGWCGQQSREGNGLTVGCGVNVVDRAQLDYAWTPYGELGDYHRVALYFSLE